MRRPEHKIVTTLIGPVTPMEDVFGFRCVHGPQEMFLLAYQTHDQAARARRKLCAQKGNFSVHSVALLVAIQEMLQKAQGDIDKF